MVEIINLTKKYGENIIFDNYSFKINNNTITAIIGESGMGKTTLLNIIGLLDDDYSGQVIINGKNVSNLKANKRLKFIRENLCYLFQDYALIENETVEYNLLLALEYEIIKKEEKQKIINYALKSVGLLNYNKKIIYTLSGGEQQRVALARTMIKAGSIVLADEPTGNLDKNNADMVFKLLKKLKANNKTVIIVTHDMDLANKCDNIIKL